VNLHQKLASKISKSKLEAEALALKTILERNGIILNDYTDGPTLTAILKSQQLTLYQEIDINNPDIVHYELYKTVDSLSLDTSYEVISNATIKETNEDSRKASSQE